jgi:hypothetical protein
MSDKPRVAMKMMVDGEVREITVEQLVISNQLSQEALVSLLVKKGMIEPKDLLSEIDAIRKVRYRSGEPGDASSG